MPEAWIGVGAVPGGQVAVDGVCRDVGAGGVRARARGPACFSQRRLRYRAAAEGGEFGDGPPVGGAGGGEDDAEVLSSLRGEGDGLGRGGAGAGGDAGEGGAVGRDFDVVAAGVVAGRAAGVHLDLVEGLRGAEVDLEKHAGGLIGVGAVPGGQVAVDGVCRDVGAGGVRACRRDPARFRERSLGSGRGGGSGDDRLDCGRGQAEKCD